jgi:hypothetical protein
MAPGATFYDVEAISINQTVIVVNVRVTPLVPAFVANDMDHDALSYYA